jgi:hypothetical protein
MIVLNPGKITQVRKQFEEGGINQELLSQLYEDYAQVGDTTKFVSKAKEIFPRGNCGLATLYLRQIIGGEIIRGAYANQGHTFLMLDKRIIDITADQFGGPKVYIGPLRSPWALRKPS